MYHFCGTNSLSSFEWSLFILRPGSKEKLVVGGAKPLGNYLDHPWAATQTSVPEDGLGREGLLGLFVPLPIVVTPNHPPLLTLALSLVY